MLGPSGFTSPCGLADVDPTELGASVVGAWDEFLSLTTAADLARPSRLSGLTCGELLIHLGTWDDHAVLSALVEAARAGGGVEPSGEDNNPALIAVHRDDDILEALQRSRDELAEWFAGPQPVKLGRKLVRSSVGDLPLLSLLSAGSYELAVHALDVHAKPTDYLLQRGLAALIDVTGRLASKHEIAMTVTAQTPAGGWSFASSVEGWRVTAVAPGPYEGVGVRGTAADLLDASAGRHAVPALLLQRRLVVQHLPSFMKLAPIVSEVPGLPGGAALRAGIGGVSAVTGGVSKVLGRFFR